MNTQSDSKFGNHSPATIQSAKVINLRWLTRLRWGFAIALGLSACLMQVLSVSLPVTALTFALLSLVISNVLIHRRLRVTTAIGELDIVVPMLIDAALLTAIFYSTGGPFNPFTVLYLVHIALAAVMLRPRWSGLLAAISMASFGALFLLHQNPMTMSHSVEHLHQTMDHDINNVMSWHLRGMWLAFSFAAMAIVYFVSRSTMALAQRDQELEQEREHNAINSKLAAMASLAAGTAHELGSPLATIAIAADELKSTLEEPSFDRSECLEDAKVICEQVTLCRSILQDLGRRAGVNGGEAFIAVTLVELIDNVVKTLDKERFQIEIEASAREIEILVPINALSQALRAVCINALHASQNGTDVIINAAVTSDCLNLRVTDFGIGMDPALLARAGEAFFTTKSSDKGMGLGLFLARALFAQLGGSVLIQSTRERGTQVTMQMPLSQSRWA